MVVYDSRIYMPIGWSHLHSALREDAAVSFYELLPH